jgi:hypothetical protein
MNDRQSPSFAAPGGLTDPTLPAGTRLGTFELQRAIARSPSSVVYQATDHALALTVAIQEYLPARLVRRDSGLRLRATDTWHEDVIARGLRAFIDEARLLAHCDHPALVRVSQLFEVNGTAYRVMPFYRGRRLYDLRRTLTEAPDEASLRALLDDLLGALETIHRGGRAHGGVTPGNILLLGDDHPLLLGPGAAAREIGSDLVDSLMATLETPLAPEPPDVLPSGPIADLCALAEVIRFCITGTLAPATGLSGGRESMDEVIARSFEPAARPRYSAELLGTLDAAMSPSAEDWPLSVAQLRTWLARGAPRALARAAQRRESMFAAAAAPPAHVAEHANAGSLFSEPPPRRPAPEASTIHAYAEPPTAPMTTDRAPWLAPPVRMVAPRQRRGRKLMMASALAAFAVVVLAVVSGAWDQVPAIAFDHLPKLGFDRPVVDTPAPAVPPEPIAKALATAPTVASAPAPAPAPASASAAAPAGVAAPVAEASSVPAPPVAQVPPAAPPVTEATAASAQAASTSASMPAPPVQAAPREVAPVEPAATVGAVAETSAKALEKKRPTAERPRRAAAAPPAQQPVATIASPRAACTGKSEFALYRCMRQLCDAPRWYGHPQCIRLRATDRAE